MTKHLLSFIIITTCLALTACRSSQNVQAGQGGRSNQATTTTPINRSQEQANRSEATAYAASAAGVKAHTDWLTASAKVQLGGTGKDLSVNGQLRMKRGEVIRLSLRFLGIEVGLMEFTPSGVLVIDRMNKRYVQAAYTDVPFLQTAGLDFYTLQALFWDELFVPGTHDAAGQAARFALSHTADGKTTLSLTDTPKLHYIFVTNPQGKYIEQVRVSRPGVKTDDFSCTYDSFEAFAGRQFPTRLALQTRASNKNFTLTLDLSSLKTNDGWETRTTPPTRYARMSLDQVLKGLHL